MERFQLLPNLTLTLASVRLMTSEAPLRLNWFDMHMQNHSVQNLISQHNKITYKLERNKTALYS